MAFVIQLIIGLIFSSLIGVLAHRRGSLTRGGAWGAVIVGTSIFGFGGFVPGMLLIVFFVTSSALSHYKEEQKEAAAEKFAKSHQRDLGQALANAGVASLLAIAHVVYPAPLLLAALAGALATVNADTWATELGVLHKTPPRLITTWKVVEVGTSGGVTLSGLWAKLGGSLLIGVVMWGLYALISLFNIPMPVNAWIIPAVLAGGIGGSYFDSLLGATVQATYFCPECKKETEKEPVHTCGMSTSHIRGWLWLNNDLVNAISSLVGALIAAGVWELGIRRIGG